MTQANIDVEKYNEFISAVNIKNVSLNSLNVTDVNKKIERSDLNFTLNYDANNPKISLNGDALEVFPCFTVEVTNDNQKEPGFTITAEFVVEYEIKGLESFTQDYVEFFVSRNVPINTWPYARELISSITTRIGYPALVIDPYKG